MLPVKINLIRPDRWRQRRRTMAQRCLLWRTVLPSWFRDVKSLCRYSRNGAYHRFGRRSVADCCNREWKRPETVESRTSTTRGDETRMSVKKAPTNYARRVAAIGITGLVVSFAWATGCGRQTATPTTVRHLTIAVGEEGTVSYRLGKALTEAYQSRIPAIQVHTTIAGGVDESFEALRNAVADLGFIDAEGAYIGYRREKSGVSPTARLRAIAVLYPTAIHVFTKRRGSVRSISQLRGRTIVLGERGGYADRTMQLVLESYQLGPDAVHRVFAVGPAGLAAVQQESADGIVFYTPFRSKAIMDVIPTSDLELVSLKREKIAQMQAASERNHFLKTITIPAGTYPGQTRDVLTVGDEILLLCRADLDQALVYALTKSLFDSIPSLTAAHPIAASINVERGPMTSVPLHPGAARYYRERELPR
jgi:uncharacterized protein